MRLKFITMGSPGVGKSCLVKRFSEKRFVPKYSSTIGIDYGVMHYNCKAFKAQADVKIHFFDMGGDPAYRETRCEFYENTQGAILVYDVGSKASFKALEGWLAEMRVHSKKDDFANVIVVGNKADLYHEIPEHEGRLWADSHGFEYTETSCSTGANVDDLFELLCKLCVETVTSGPPPCKTLSYSHEQLDAVRLVCDSVDDFEALGVSPRASKKDIMTSFKRLAKIIHPDKNSVPGSVEAFKKINAAKHALLTRK